MQELTLDKLGIKEFTATGNYQVDIPYNHLHKAIDRFLNDEPKLDLNPDFQRGHVWNQSQQIAFVEYILKGGKTSTLLFNCPGWMHDFRGPFVIVDGLQRLTALLTFWNNGLKSFGHIREEFNPSTFFGISIRICVNALKTRKEVLNWYLELNTGGTPHSETELNRVADLLRQEK